MDPLLLLAYFAVPATITLVAFVGLKLHERSAPPMPADPATLTPSANYTARAGFGIIGSVHVYDVATRISPGSAGEPRAEVTVEEVNLNASTTKAQ